MIVFKDNKLEIKEPKTVELNGVYNAIVIDAFYESDNDRLVYLYIPEVYGIPESGTVKNNICDYPRVSMLYQQDNDDPGHEPETGELVRVSFDNGDSNSCRFMYYVPIDNRQVIIQNKNFIENGVLPSGIIEDITDPNILNKMKTWLKDVYYITIGKEEPDKESFLVRDLVSDTGFCNYFVEPLMVPIATYNREWGLNSSTTTVPLFTTGIYVLLDIMRDIYDDEQGKKDLLNMFNNPPLEGGTHKLYNPDIFNKNGIGDFREKHEYAVLSGISTLSFKIAFPNITEEEQNWINTTASQDGYIIEPAAYWSCWQLENRTIDNLFSHLLHNYKKFYEDEWASTCAGWFSGLNNITENTKVKKVVSFCLTLCPWFAAVLFGYIPDNFKLMQQVKESGVITDEQYDVIYGFNGLENRSYSAIIENDDKFIEIQNKLRQIIQKENLKDIVLTFRDTMHELFDSKESYELGIFFVNPGAYDEKSWDSINMNAKWDRLLKLAEKIASESDVPEVPEGGTSMDVPILEGFKSWMPYTALSTSSPNYKMLMDMGTVDSNGLWKIGDFYCVAMASYYSKKLGDTFNIVLDSGKSYKAITVDHKADIHTDAKHQYTTASRCITEFIVDRSRLNHDVAIMGSVNVLPEFKGVITGVIKLGNIYD